jgi:hypothetical protein
MVNQIRTRRTAAALIALATLAITCSPLPFGLGGGGQDANSRVATLEAELQDARETAAAEPAMGAEEPSVAGGGGGSLVEEDFREDNGAFTLDSGASIEDGALLVGPYESCANDVANFDAPVGCISVCTACGRNLSDFTLKVEFTFEDGLSDREFGVALRFLDEDVDSMLDRPDYLLALGFNIFENRWRLYLHEPDKIEPWRVIASDKAGFLLPGRMNQLEVRAFENGRRMEIRLNDRFLTLLTADHPEPGERLVEQWADAGAVGIMGLGRGVQARFDNFQLTLGS